MNVLIVDTSVWISYFAGNQQRNIDVALAEGRVYLPVIVVSELLSGKMNSSQEKSLLSFLEELPLCAHDFEHWKRVGVLRRRLLQKGFEISTPDAHVAQCAVDLDGYLASEDKIFGKIASFCGFKMQ